jgi:hypothetical protein
LLLLLIARNSVRQETCARSVGEVLVGNRTVVINMSAEVLQLPSDILTWCEQPAV